MFNSFDFKNIQTPSYVCFETNLRKNCEILKSVKDQTGAKILLALKGFALQSSLDIVMEYLDGFTCSGLWEAKLAKKYTKKQNIHTYSPAFGDDFKDIASISSHIVFNSANMLKKYLPLCKNNHLAIRCNPGVSFAPVELYNPCGEYSRFGVRSVMEIEDVLNHLEGLCFHALCEEGSESLEVVLKAFEEKFEKAIKRVKWVNFGGGHHITKEGYNLQKLIKLINDFKKKWGVEVYLEPGEAVGINTGVLVCSVLDIIKRDKNIAILDTSAEAHMPDTIIMPYTSEVLNAKIISTRYDLSSAKNHKNGYILTGNTCLSGDIMGYYEFDKELCVGDKVVFLDQMHYSIVKNTTFNGIKLPSLVLIDKNGDIKNIKQFNFNDFSRRN